jgi:ribitol-5-phosphate 2-dehydrogenase (NADP+) / D-ribitol-5-phosphate cytidylyltransferase
MITGWEVEAVRTVAVILTRPPGDPSQAGDGTLLAPLAGRPVLEHSVAACEAAMPVSEILVVADPATAVQVRRHLAGRGYRKMAGILEGGPTRAHDIAAVMATVGDPECHVLIHDAAYPLVTTPVIEKCAAALRIHSCVCTAVPASDTMVGVENNLITVRPERDRLRRRQSPQGFHLSVLRRAYQLALADPAPPQDDECALVLRYLPDVPVALVPGAAGSIKITTAADIALTEAMLAASPR